MVTMSGGTYLTTGIKMPNNSRLVGQGKDITTIKFMDSTPAENIGITNLRMGGHAENISLEISHLMVISSDKINHSNQLVVHVQVIFVLLA